MDIKSIISVILGGFLGGIVRDLLNSFFTTDGILIANLLGCFLLTFLTYYVIEKGLLANWFNAGLGTGFIGSFTTFSSLMITIVKLAQSNILDALKYFFISSFGGLLMAGLGFFIANYLGGNKRND